MFAHSAILRLMILLMPTVVWSALWIAATFDSVCASIERGVTMTTSSVRSFWNSLDRNKFPSTGTSFKPGIPLTAVEPLFLSKPEITSVSFSFRLTSVSVRFCRNATKPLLLTFENVGSGSLAPDRELGFAAALAAHLRFGQRPAVAALFEHVKHGRQVGRDSEEPVVLEMGQILRRDQLPTEAGSLRLGRPVHA